MNFARYMLSLFFRVSLLFGGGAMTAHGAAGLRMLADAIFAVDGAAPMGWALLGTGVSGLLVACAGVGLGFVAAVGLLKRVEAGPVWGAAPRAAPGDRLIFEGESRARTAGIAVDDRHPFGKRSERNGAAR